MVGAFRTKAAPRAISSVAFYLAAAVSFLEIAPGLAQTPPVFRPFIGSWSGSGRLWRQNGTVERITCQAAYAPGPAGALQQRLTCRSDSTRFALINTVKDADGRLSGVWVETTRNAHGTFTGRIRGDVIQGTARGPGFAAGISIAARGGSQSVKISSQGGGINRLQMRLTRK